MKRVAFLFLLAALAFATPASAHERHHEGGWWPSIYIGPPIIYYPAPPPVIYVPPPVWLAPPPPPVIYVPPPYNPPPPYYCPYGCTIYR